MQVGALDESRLRAAVAHPGAGAVVVFTGVVRDHDAGRQVRGIEYEAHPGAGAVLADLAEQAAGRPGVRRAAVVHRSGTLAVGDVAVVAAVSADHRAEAFAACSELVDAVKSSAPIWKRQLFADGTSEWVGTP